jgi:hypothetical protein
MCVKQVEGGADAVRPAMIHALPHFSKSSLTSAQVPRKLLADQSDAVEHVLKSGRWQVLMWPLSVSASTHAPLYTQLLQPTLPIVEDILHTHMNGCKRRFNIWLVLVAAPISLPSWLNDRLMNRRIYLQIHSNGCFRLRQ